MYLFHFLQETADQEHIVNIMRGSQRGRIDEQCCEMSSIKPRQPIGMPEVWDKTHHKHLYVYAFAVDSC